MAAIIREINIFYNEYAINKQDPRSLRWFMMGSIWQPLLVLAIYFYFVLDWGPRFMSGRPPFKLDLVLRLYNIIQIFLNLYILERCLTLGWFTTYRWICEPVDWSETPLAIEIAAGCWSYMMLKFIDLLDTVFFVLRKSHRQVSFLHLYHHAGMFMMCWGGAKYTPGGHLTFVGLVNSIVHTVMYAYYFAVNTWPHLKNTRWKKHVTQLQMIQFFLIALHSSTILLMDPKTCFVPKWQALLLFVQTFVLFVFFTDFYYRTYIKKKQK